MPVNQLASWEPVKRGVTKPPSDFIIGSLEPDGKPFMPRHGVHVIGGASGAGKTTFLFQLLTTMRREGTFFGRPTRNLKIAYATLDRDYAETDETLERMGIDKTQWPIYQYDLRLALQSDIDDHRIEVLLDSIHKLQPAAEVIIIDGIMMVAMHGRINEYQAMAFWFGRIKQWCNRHNIAVIGLVHSTKNKKGQEITDPRQMVLGSVASAGVLGSMLIFQSANKEDHYKLHFIGRNTATDTVDVEKDANGLIIESPKDSAKNQSALFDIMGQWPPNTPVALSVILAETAKKNLSRATTCRALTAAVAAGELYKPAFGKYARHALSPEDQPAQSTAAAASEAPGAEQSATAGISKTDETGSFAAASILL